jgi:hypothetical protein
MGMKRVLILLLSLPVASAQAAYIANRDFLSVGEGARANGMGEAFAAVADDSSAIFWNPAGLTQLRSDEVSFTGADRFDGLASDATLHYARRGAKAMWGFGYTGSYVKNVDITQSLTTDDVNAILSGSFAPGDYPQKSITDHAFLFSYARPIRPDSPHSLGATVKVIYRDILGMVHGYGTSVDLGYHYVMGNSGLRFGANLQNAASLVSFTGNIDNLGVKATATESYTPNLKAGLAYEPGFRLLNGKLLLAGDVDMLTSFDVDDYRLGLEYTFGSIVSLRAGKVFGRQDDSSEDYTLGMGLRLKQFLVDFSFLTNELGDTTRVTLGYKIGGDYFTPSGYSR